MDLADMNDSKVLKPEQRRRSVDNGAPANPSQVAIEVSLMGASSTPLANIESARHTADTGHFRARRGYVERRISLWHHEDTSNSASVNPNDMTNETDGAQDPDHAHAHDHEQPSQEQQVVLGAVSSLPLPIQRAFRKKMLSIFAFQLLFVWFLVSCFAYLQHLHQAVHETFRQQGYVAIPFVILVFLLGFLYLVRERFPLNWLILLMFSLAQSVFYAALGELLDTNVGVFCCGFTFCAVSLMIPLSTLVRQPRQPPPPPPQQQQQRQDATEPKLVSSFLAGCLAYGLVAGLAVIAKLVFKNSLVTTQAFLYSMVLQLVLILWFASDASSMYRIMTPDEYMQGVIYFYTDLVLLVVMIMVFVGLIALFSACGGEGVGAFTSVDCGFLGCNGGSDCACCVCCCEVRNEEHEHEHEHEHEQFGNGTGATTSTAPVVAVVEDYDMAREGIV